MSKKHGAGAKMQRAQWRNRFILWLRHHRNENSRALRELKNNKIGSLLTILVLAVALALPAGLQVVIDNSARLTSRLHDSVRLSVFLKTTASPEDAKRLTAHIEKNFSPASIRLVSPEEGLALLEQRAGLGNALQYLDANPLPWLIEIVPDKNQQAADKVAKLQADLLQLPLVDIVKIDLAWLRRLAAILEVSERIHTALAIVFALSVMLVVGNTIRLAVENHRAEIEIIKLVGATDAFIRRPFLYLGMWFGLLGGGLAWALVNANIVYLAGAVSNLVEQYAMSFELKGLSVTQGAMLVASGAGLGWIGAFMSVTRRIQAIEPV